MAEHYPTQSVAQLAGQQKVSGWSQPESNATGADGGDVSGDLNALGSAQVVSNTAPEFATKPDDPIELQKGPAKKYIDNPNNNNGNGDTNNTTTSNNNTNGITDAAQVSFAAQPVTDTSNANTGGGYDDFFAGMGDGDENTENTDNNNNNNDNSGAHPNNATFISLPTVGDNDEQYEMDDAGDESKQQEPAQTALSLWQAERRKELQERIENEKRKQRETNEEAEKDLQEFIEKRNERIGKARKDAKSREDGIRQDYDSVYKNGTIWEQVAKLVDLSTQDETVTRMRDLLIELKNQGKVQKK